MSKIISEDFEKYVGRFREIILLTFLRNISEHFEKYFLKKISSNNLENFEKFLGKFREVFQNISKIIPESFEK